MEEIVLSPELSARMRKAMDKEKALQLFVDQVVHAGQGKREALNQFVSEVVEQGRARAEALLGENRQLWTEIAEVYGLDLKMCQFEPSPDGLKLVKVAQRFA